MFIIVVVLIFLTICDGFGVISSNFRNSGLRLPWASRFAKQIHSVGNKARTFVRPQAVFRNQLFQTSSAIFATENSEDTINPEVITGGEDDDFDEDDEDGNPIGVLNRAKWILDRQNNIPPSKREMREVDAFYNSDGNSENSEDLQYEFEAFSELNDEQVSQLFKERGIPEHEPVIYHLMYRFKKGLSEASINNIAPLQTEYAEKFLRHFQTEIIHLPAASTAVNIFYAQDNSTTEITKANEEMQDFMKQDPYMVRNMVESWGIIVHDNSTQVTIPGLKAGGVVYADETELENYRGYLDQDAGNDDEAKDEDNDTDKYGDDEEEEEDQDENDDNEIGGVKRPDLEDDQGNIVDPNRKTPGIRDPDLDDTTIWDK